MARTALLWIGGLAAGWLLAYPVAGTVGAAAVVLALGGALVLCLHLHVLSAPAEPSRLHQAISGALTGGVSLLCTRVLVANWSDNAYLLIALYGMALQLPAALFLLAAIAPWAVVRRWAPRAAVLLVWLLGAFALIPVPFILFTLEGALLAGVAGALLNNPVTTGHLLAGGLAVLLVLLPGWWWARRPGDSPPADPWNLGEESGR